MRESAFELARLRASRSLPITAVDLEQLTAAVRGSGRGIVRHRDLDGREAITLGWDDRCEPDPPVWGIAVQRLAPVAFATLAACLHCCWPDPATELADASTSRASEILRVVTSWDVHEIWAKAALFTELPASGLVLLDRSVDPIVRVGPTLVALPVGELALLRRSHRRFGDIAGST